MTLTKSENDVQRQLRKEVKARHKQRDATEAAEAAHKNQLDVLQAGMMAIQQERNGDVAELEKAKALSAKVIEALKQAADELKDLKLERDGLKAQLASQAEQVRTEAMLKEELTNTLHQKENDLTESRIQAQESSDRSKTLAREKEGLQSEKDTVERKLLAAETLLDKAQIDRLASDDKAASLQREAEEKADRLANENEQLRKVY